MYQPVFLFVWCQKQQKMGALKCRCQPPSLMLVGMRGKGAGVSVCLVLQLAVL